ncbi:hypothetical protein [Paraburkholderia franconis]|nr:hypothetical protein [Paraburkholderia franconis]
MEPASAGFFVSATGSASRTIIDRSAKRDAMRSPAKNKKARDGGL